MKIYVGNLPYQTSEEDIRQEFESFGTVDTVSVVTDRETGRPRGFAFVEMSSASEGNAAIESMNGKMMGERTIVVNEARPRNDSRGGGSFGGNRRTGNSRGFGGGGFGGGRQKRD